VSKGSERSGSGLFIGLLVGLIIGAIVALLLAPQEGEATRTQLREQFDQMRHRYGDAVAEGRTAYTQAKEEVHSSMQHAATEAKA